jgi:precorrin-2 dehydrogenase/sirohydrochlorin ferrochelatase
MGKYPIFLEMAGRRAVLIGAGTVAVRKAQPLLDAGARLTVVAERIDDILTDMCHKTDSRLIKSAYSKEYLVGASLVIAATNNQSLNKRIYDDCQELEILCNIVDKPEFCDFFVPAVVKRGALQIAISTDGNCPAYAGHVRKKLEQVFTERHGHFVKELEEIRQRVITEIADPAERKAILGALVHDNSFDFFIENDAEKWRDYADGIMAIHSKKPAESTPKTEK